MIAELCRPNWKSESCTINTRESSKEISQRRDTIHAKQQAHSVVLRVPWVPYSMGDTWVSKVNMRWTSMKLNKNPWTAVRLSSLPQWLSCWELLLGSDQPSAWLCFMLFCQHWTRNCSQLANLPCFCLISPQFPAIGTEMFPGTATPSTRSCTSSPQTRSQISRWPAQPWRVLRIAFLQWIYGFPLLNIQRKSSSQALWVYEVWWWSSFFLWNFILVWQRPRPETPSVSRSKNISEVNGM